MNLEELYIPATISSLMNEVLVAKNGDNGHGGKDEIKVEERLLIELFLLAGAVSLSDLRKMNKNESVVSSGSQLRPFVSDNQGISMGLPEVIVQEWSGEGENLVRAIMNYKNRTLKEVAERYGGKSGAANLANFMAKSNEDLAGMRDSTLRRLAEALECPVDWLMVVREKSQDLDGAGKVGDEK